MKSMRLVAAAAFLVLAACSSSATEPAATRADRPSFDGINTLGSGGRIMGSGNDVVSTSTMPSDTTSTEDGGNGMGSGN
ncbi:MAG: hypothetical protein KY444_10380 [Gemmatimonadetes bacterium]|nr:hypothetical protein [Gemmatimonadota bacterium]